LSCSWRNLWRKRTWTRACHHRPTRRDRAFDEEIEPFRIWSTPAPHCRTGRVCCWWTTSRRSAACCRTPHGSAATFQLPNPQLAAGHNEIKWKGLSKDGHVVTGTLVYEIKPKEAKAS
jgi:hypothetical protein